MTPQENHEKTTFRAFFETKGPRDPPLVQERQILFRIALTRALYDQMAPSYARFPFQDLECRSTVKKTVRKKLGLVATKDTVRIKGKSQLVLFVSDSFTKQYPLESSFYPDGVC